MPGQILLEILIRTFQQRSKGVLIQVVGYIQYTVHIFRNFQFQSGFELCLISRRHLHDVVGQTVQLFKLLHIKEVLLGDLRDGGLDAIEGTILNAFFTETSGDLICAGFADGQPYPLGNTLCITGRGDRGL